MVTLLILAWLVSCVLGAGRIGGALCRRWVSRGRQAPVSLPMQRRGA